jgi:hypothetical protein
MMRLFYLIFISLLVYPLMAQPEFYVQRSLPDWNYLAKAPNSNTFYAAGAFGAIYKSTDNGATWHGLNSVLETAVTGIFFISEETGWAVTWTGKIEKTTNQGDAWTLISDQTNQPLRDIFFVNVNTGFAGGGPVKQRLPNKDEITSVRIGFHYNGKNYDLSITVNDNLKEKLKKFLQQNHVIRSID